MGSDLVVGIAGCVVSDDPKAVLVTYALGSCIGVSAWDPVARIGGLLHFMLPEYSADVERGRGNPFLFADTGIPALVEGCVKQGAKQSRLVVRAAGAAAVLSSEIDYFNIGKRNHLGMRKALWKTGLFLHAEDIGGTVSRTMRLELASGRCWIQVGGQVVELTSARAQGAICVLSNAHR